VREWGDPQGAAVFLIHGWSQNHLSWKHQFNSSLANEFRLVALDNRGHGMSEKLDNIGPGFLENAPEASTEDLPTNIAAIRRFLRACTAKPMGAEDLEKALCYNMVVPPQVRGALVSRRIDSDDVLSRMTLPVLMTHGTEDTVVLPSMGQHILDVCQTAEASWYEAIGHAPFLEDPERFNRELADFTRRVNE
jgi:non-heme chloroperoxidase